MNSASTVDLLDIEAVSETVTTGLWREGREQQPGRTLALPRMATVAWLAFSLSISPVTTMPDPWLSERKRRDAVVTISVYQEVLGRSISRSEALRIARRILEQAERERLNIAEFEAARGIQWGKSA